MDLESFTKVANEIVANIPVTIQINKLTSSHLSVVFNRQKDCNIEYTDLRSVESDMRLSQKWTHYSCKKRDFSLISLSS
jgi:hypothetical protein